MTKNAIYLTFMLRNYLWTNMSFPVERAVTNWYKLCHFLSHLMSFSVANGILKKGLYSLYATVYSIIEYKCIIISIMSFSVAHYITFCRRNKAFMSFLVAHYVIFCRTLCHFLSQAIIVKDSISTNYATKNSLNNNLKNNLMNYSNKLFNEEESPKPFLRLWTSSSNSL